ncbi:M23 family metallopeptidase [Bacteroides sp. OttesenSCG-928-E20]|nr:M23 family metallopeptidase [Bacteroides sp. OttesenSCG-928-E20]MDL2304558.1 M23 family metallopeptidase [Bacteroides sp. OttesenSCG-928-D19]
MSISEIEQSDSILINAKPMSENTSKWIQQYLSVSYPLDRMVVNSPYGMRRDPFTGKRKQHNGIDFHARSDEVYAMMRGDVVKVGQDKRSGIFIILQHGNYTVSYCHLSSFLVKTGSKVKVGEAVAITGNSGKSTGEHLHLGVKCDGKYINPDILLQYIKNTRKESQVNLLSGL